MRHTALRNEKTAKGAACGASNRIFDDANFGWWEKPALGGAFIDEGKRIYPAKIRVTGPYLHYSIPIYFNFFEQRKPSPTD